MTKNAGILFDYNGVIVDDEHLQRDAMAQGLVSYNVVLTPELNTECCVGRPDRDGFLALREKFSQLAQVSIEDFIQEKHARYHQLIETKSILYPGIQSILQKLREHFVFALVTGASSIEVLPILEKEDIKNFFQTIVTADDIMYGKPNPEGYLKGLAALGLSKDRVVAVEDTFSGIKAAKAAGIKCIAVLHTSDKENLAAADLILDTVKQLTPEIVFKLIDRDYQKQTGGFFPRI